MRTCIPVRGLSVLPLLAILLGAFACSGSPNQPDPVMDSTMVSRSQAFDGADDERPQRLERAADDTAIAEDGDAAEVDDIELDGLDIHTATASGTSVSGVVRDKSYSAWTLSGVKVKAGAIATTTNTKGEFTLKTRPGNVTFTKTDYTEIRKVLNRATGNEVLMAAIVPRGMNVRCKNRSWMAAKTLTGACSGKSGVAYWIEKPAALSNLSLSPSSTPENTDVKGTVTLNKAAPSGGAKVFLSSTTSAASVPASVTIAAGQKSGTFTVGAEAEGTPSINAKYDQATKGAKLTVTGVRVPEPVARFEWDPQQCDVKEEAGGNPLLVKCRFDASDSTAPAGSTYNWTFPGGNEFSRNTPILSNPPLACGSVADGAFGRTVTLIITTQAGVNSAARSLTVTFVKDGLC